MAHFTKRAGVLLLILYGGLARSTGAGQTPSRTREFAFTYAAAITQLPPGTSVRIWFPVPSPNEEQQVEAVDRRFPLEPEMAWDKENGNRIGYFTALAPANGVVDFQITYRVTRHEIGEGAAMPEASAERYLKADRLVPVNGRPMSLLSNVSLPADQMQLGRVLYDVVDDHMQYRKDQPGWGRGDATWACESGFGNCTDFHSLFISLARSEYLPAKFEIGFALPEARGIGKVQGYHCWAKFLPRGHGWIPVDISQANQDPRRRDYCFGHLSENRVTFSTGRDLMLVPRQYGPPVNFLVYPSAEVEGKMVAQSQIQTRFSYADALPG